MDSVNEHDMFISEMLIGWSLTSLCYGEFSCSLVILFNRLRACLHIRHQGTPSWSVCCQIRDLAPNPTETIHFSLTVFIHVCFGVHSYCWLGSNAWLLLGWTSVAFCCPIHLHLLLLTSNEIGSSSLMDLSIIYFIWPKDVHDYSKTFVLGYF